MAPPPQVFLPQLCQDGPGTRASGTKTHFIGYVSLLDITTVPEEFYVALLE